MFGTKRARASATPNAAATTEKEEEMEQQELKVQPRSRRTFSVQYPVLSHEYHVRLRALSERVPLDRMARWWVENGGWHRTTTKDRMGAAKKLIGQHIGEPGKTGCAPVIADLERMITSFETMLGVRADRALERATAGTPDVEVRVGRLEAMLERVLERLVARPVAPQLPEKVAPVIRIPTERDQINSLIKQVSKGDDQFGARYKRLYHVVGSRIGLDWYGYAEAHGLPTEGDGWMLTVAEHARRIGEVLVIARELFSPQASSSKA
jgi:hypothetical protein